MVAHLRPGDNVECCRLGTRLLAGQVICRSASKQMVLVRDPDGQRVHLLNLANFDEVSFVASFISRFHLLH
jgi:hypothetical protein